MGSSPVGVQVKANQIAQSNLKHAGLLSIKAANEWIQDSLKTPDPKMYFYDLIVQYENTVILPRVMWVSQFWPPRLLSL